MRRALLLDESTLSLYQIGTRCSFLAFNSRCIRRAAAWASSGLPPFWIFQCIAFRLAWSIVAKYSSTSRRFHFFRRQSAAHRSRKRISVMSTFLQYDFNCLLLSLRSIANGGDCLLYRAFDFSYQPRPPRAIFSRSNEASCGAFGYGFSPRKIEHCKITYYKQSAAR